MRALLCLRPLVLGCLLWAGAQPARAHEWWGGGQRVDPKTQALCCNTSDCKELDVRQTAQEKDGIRLLDTQELIPWDRVQPSPDGQVWACRWGGETKCFFYPMNF